MLASGYGAFARPVPKYNPPAHLTPLLGREQEVAAACTLLRRPEVRLVTFTGTGGVGKTRLALQVATDLLNDFPDGVSFVALAPISDPDLVVPTIAQTLGIKETGARPPVDLLKTFLRDEVGGQRGAVCCFRPLKDFSDGFMKTVLLQPPLPEPCRLLSQHTALQRGDSTGIGLLRHPPHPLGSVHLLLWPFTLSWALPQAFDYYDHSAPMRLSPCRQSHRLTFPFVRL